MDKTTKKLLKKKNVVMVGWGKKLKGGEDTGREALVVGVKKKVSILGLEKKDWIPLTIDGFSTDVVEVGDIKLLGVDRTSKARPSPCGMSIGHKDITAGTQGLVVRKGGTKYILSNNHVLANVNKGEIGDAIMQPGPHDITPEMGDCRIGTLAEFVPISKLDLSECLTSKIVAKLLNFFPWLFHRKTRMVPMVEPGINKVDCALALPDTSTDALETILDVGTTKGATEAEVGLKVKKSGRTTELTFGEITAINAVVNVGLGGMDFAIFEDQIVTPPMAEGGDSGSALLDLENNIVGLLFAGSEQSTIFGRWANVKESLELD